MQVVEDYNAGGIRLYFIVWGSDSRLLMGGGGIRKEVWQAGRLVGGKLIKRK